MLDRSRKKNKKRSNYHLVRNCEKHMVIGAGQQKAVLGFITLFRKPQNLFLSFLSKNAN